MYGHPPQGMQNQKIRYSTQPQQSYPTYPQPVMSNSQYNTQNAYHQPPAQHYQMSNVEMYNNPNAMRNNPQASGYGHQQQYMGANAALIQPPALNVEQNIDTNSQFFPPRQPMTMSNNQHSEFDNMQQQQQQQMWTNEAQIASMFWQQRCMTMLQRFEWFYQRFQILRGEYINLSEEMQKMDSEQQWHNFQQHHDQFHQKIAEMEQELAAVLGENEQLLQQRQQQEADNMWEQRYQELLGNFKSLQQEMSSMEGGGRRVGGVPPEQYHQLESQYTQLQYQYNLVAEELQSYREAGMHINQYLEEIDNYKQKLQGLHHQNVEMQQMILELEQKNKRLEQGQQNVVERSKYDELMYMIDQKEREIEQMQQEFKTKSVSQSAVSQYQAVLASKNGQIQLLKQKLVQKEKEISLGVIKLQSVEGSLRNTLNSEFQNEKYQLERKINELERVVDDMKRESVRSTSQNNKTEALERKIESLNNEVSNLNDSLKKKNQELNELRGMSYEIDRLRENESNYSKVLEEKTKLSDLLKKKNAQIESMHLEVEKLSVKIHEVSNKKQEYSTRNLMIQIEDLNDQLRRYQGEITKLKNIIELKEQYTQKLQADIRLINEKYISTEQILLNQRQNWKETEIKLNSKNLQHQKRIKNLDYEFNLQLKENLEKEVIALRKQNVEKQENIRAMEEKELLLSSQIAVFQKLKNNFDRDISLLRKKEKELESLNEAQVRRFKQLQAAYLAKENDVDELKMNQVSMSSQLTALKTQVEDCNSLIKTKNRTIQNLQTEIKQQLGRTQLVDELMNQNGKMKIALKSAQQQLQRLKFNGQSRIEHNKVLSRVQSRKDLEREQKNVINQLQEENSYLKVEISKLLEKQTSSKSIPHQSVPISPQSKLVSVDLNKRLSEFNLKLQHTINEPKGTLTHSKSQKVIELWQNERRQLVDRYEQQIANLKQQINERQAQRMNVTQKTQQSNISQSPRKQAYSHLQSQQLREQILFFRQKYKQQQDRNQTLVKINQELKSKLDSALKIRQGVNTTDYYKEQIKLLENENELLKNKSKKLLEENKEIKIELNNKNSKLSKDYELKILELELTIQEQKRKVSYLNAEKASANNERASLQHNYNITSYERDSYQPKTYKVQKYYEYIPQSPKNFEQEFQSVLGNLRGNPSPKNNQQSYGPISQISSNTYNDSRINPVRSRLQK